MESAFDRVGNYRSAHGSGSCDWRPCEYLCTDSSAGRYNLAGDKSAWK